MRGRRAAARHMMGNSGGADCLRNIANLAPLAGRRQELGIRLAWAAGDPPTVDRKPDTAVAGAVGPGLAFGPAVS